MADFGDAFVDFLKAYGHISSLNALDASDTSQARVNAVFARHKSSFDAWMKCPDWLKNKYHGKIPYAILTKAASDPNFTEDDAYRVDVEYQKGKAPYSVVPDTLSESPAYEPLCTCGAKFTAAHVAAMKLMSETYARNHYSYENAQKVAAEYAARGALSDRKEEINANQQLSSDEKKTLLADIDEQIRLSRQRELETKRAERKNHPEKTIISWLMRVQTHRMSKNDATVEISDKLQKLIDSDKLVLLAQEMAGPKYQKLVNSETKDFFANILKENGIDPNAMNQMQNDFITNNKQQNATQDSLLPTQNTAYIQQQMRQMRYLR